MPTSVNIQGKLFYGLIPLWILALFLLISLFIFIRNKKRANKKSQRKDPDRSPKIKHVTPSKKEKYITILSDLKKAYLQEEISEKEFYQDLSFTIREFIEVSTGFDITKKTLEEIKLMHLPGIGELMEEIYVPEFSEESSGSPEKIIDKAIRIIEKWS